MSLKKNDHGSNKVVVGTTKQNLTHYHYNMEFYKVLYLHFHVLLYQQCLLLTIIFIIINNGIMWKARGHSYPFRDAFHNFQCPHL